MAGMPPRSNDVPLQVQPGRNPPSTEENPTENAPAAKKKCFPGKKKKGDRGFIEGCLYGLCCCWLCEVCF